MMGPSQRVKNTARGTTAALACLAQSQRCHRET